MYKPQTTNEAIRIQKTSRFRRYWCIALASVLLISSLQRAVAQPVTAPSIQKTKQEVTAIEQLKKDLEGILQDPKAANATWGITIQSLKNGESLFELNQAKCFLPASNLKIVTSAAALSLLSPTFQYMTELVTNGKITKGVLKGDLIIRGSGDPTFGSPSMFPEQDPTFVFKKWADTLERLGIEKIEGNIIVDDTYFTDELYPIGWSIDDASYYYAMQTSGLAFADNSVSVSVSPNLTAGSKPFIAIIPETDYIEKNNKAVTRDAKKIKDSTSEKHLITVMRELGTNTINVTGEIEKGAPAMLEQIAVESPSLYAATVFREMLEYQGITITGGTMTTAELEEKIPYKTAKTLAQQVSPPLKDIVQVMNKKSNNLYAEQLFRTIAKETTGEGSWKQGSATIKKFLVSLGVNSDNFSLRDGSGLSRMDLVTPEGMLTILKAMYHDARLWQAFSESLPIMGKDGTLSGRLTGTLAEGNIRAKTGFLTGVRSLCGYLTTKDNEMLAFTIYANNFTANVKDINNLQDVMLLRLVNFSRK